MRVLFFAAIAALFAIIPAVSYAESDFALAGNGFEIIDDKVQKFALQAYLKTPESGLMFQSGQISLGNDVHSIEKMAVSLSDNKKLLRLDANAGDITMTATGKLVLSIGNDLVYQISGKTSGDTKFSIFARLKQNTVEPSLDSEEKKNVLLLVKQTERVEWKSPYKFTLRTFDPKSNTLSDFYGNSGYVEGVPISANVTNPIDEVIKTSSGVTQKYGYYEDSVIIPDNAQTGIYKLSVIVSGKDYQTVKQEFTFRVIPLSTRPS